MIFEPGASAGILRDDQAQTGQLVAPHAEMASYGVCRLRNNVFVTFCRRRTVLSLARTCVRMRGDSGGGNMVTLMVI